jgi:hypothetical protein
MGDENEGYCPIRYLNNDGDLARWRTKYGVWRSRVPRRYHHYAYPEIFDLVSVARLFAVSRPWLEQRGFFELTREDEEQVDALLATDIGRVFNHGVEWMDFALRHLAMSNPQLAKKLAETPMRYEAFAALGAELEVK